MKGRELKLWEAVKIVEEGGKVVDADGDICKSIICGRIVLDLDDELPGEGPYFEYIPSIPKNFENVKPGYESERALIWNAINHLKQCVKENRMAIEEKIENDKRLAELEEAIRWLSKGFPHNYKGTIAMYLDNAARGLAYLVLGYTQEQQREHASKLLKLLEI